MEIPLLIKVLSLPFVLRIMYKCMCKCRNCKESERGCNQGIQKGFPSNRSFSFRCNFKISINDIGCH